MQNKYSLSDSLLYWIVQISFGGSSREISHKIIL